MKRCFLLTALFQFSFLLVFPQDGFEKMMAEFEKMVNDPKSIYGKNKAVGKYYKIRGFKMYARYMARVNRFYSFMAIVVR